jgi:septal ring factor EnvC (AmiA/AmiB activator)
VTGVQAKREADDKMKNQREVNEQVRDLLSMKERQKNDVELKLTSSEENVSRIQHELNSIVADLKQANKVITVINKVHTNVNRLVQA